MRGVFLPRQSVASQQPVNGLVTKNLERLSVAAQQRTVLRQAHHGSAETDIVGAQGDLFLNCSRRDLVAAAITVLSVVEANILPLTVRAEEVGAITETPEGARGSPYAESLLPSAEQPAISRDKTQYQVLQDSIHSYRFVYPVVTPLGKQLPLVVSRKPERYSSAAPLTADARQRIVAELVDLIDAVTITVAVGPPSGILSGKPVEEWSPRQVAEAVLIDRSTARTTQGQRVSLNSVESAEASEHEGVVYIQYQHISQKSPRTGDMSRETYRFAWSVTAWRRGLDGTPYLYSLSLACPQELWQDVGPAFKTAVDSFRLLPPTSAYVAPDQDPWRFF